MCWAFTLCSVTPWIWFIRAEKSSSFSNCYELCFIKWVCLVSVVILRRCTVGIIKKSTNCCSPIYDGVYHKRTILSFPKQNRLWIYSPHEKYYFQKSCFFLRFFLCSLLQNLRLSVARVTPTPRIRASAMLRILVAGN